MNNKWLIDFIKKNFYSCKSFFLAGNEALKTPKYKKILSALVLIAVAEIPLIDAYLFNRISFSYFLNFYSLDRVVNS